MLKLVPKVDFENHSRKGSKESQQRFHLAKLLRVTEEMLVCAQEGEWEVVESMETSRKKELTACFNNIHEEDSTLIKEAIATLMHLNEKIADLIRAAKAEIIASQKQTQSTKAAVINYLSYQK